MTRKLSMFSLTGTALMVGALVLPLAASSQGTQDQSTSPSNRNGRNGVGPGMMGHGGMGPGMMDGGDGPCGMGPGMMGDDGDRMGPGGMGGWGGHGMGPGMMMNGYGMGPIWRLDLTDAQRAKINSIADTLRRQHWAIMGKIMDHQAKLRDLTSAAEPDPKAVGAEYGNISKLRQEMIETHVVAMNQARAVLSNEQRDQFDRWRRAHGGAAYTHDGAGQQGRAP